MKITLESTDRIVEVNGVKGRVWQGRSEGGTECYAVIAQIAAPTCQDNSEFETALREHVPASPQAIEAIPLRMIL